MTSALRVSAFAVVILEAVVLVLLKTDVIGSIGALVATLIGMALVIGIGVCTGGQTPRTVASMLYDRP